MNRLNTKAFFSLFVFQSMALSSLLAPLPAHAEKRSAPAPVKQWVDPGAMEKVKSDAAAPAQNSSTTPTTGDAKAVEHDGKAAPAATSQQSAGDQKTSEKSDTSKSNKMTHPSALEKAPSTPRSTGWPCAIFLKTTSQKMLQKPQTDP